MIDREDKIRERAHRIWEEEGRPDGHAEEHWHRAAREIDGPSDESQQREPSDGSEQRQEAEREVAAEPRRVTNIGAAPRLQPGAPAPNDRPGAGFASLGTAGSSVPGRPNGNKRHAKG